MKLRCNYAIFSFALFCYLPASALADCFSDCMGVCWSGRSDENVSYCSGTAARCQGECRDGVGANRKSYGAIAYSKNDGAFGFSHKWSNQQEAEKNALDACNENGPGCEVVVWFYNSCAAVAGSGDIVSWAQDNREGAAKQKALENCAKEGGKQCNLKVSHCSK